MTVDLINIIMKNIVLNIFSILIFIKLSNYKKIKYIDKLLFIISSIVFSLIYIFLKNNTDIVMSVLIIYIFQVILLKVRTKQRISTIGIGMAISIALVYILFSVAVSLEYFFQMIFNIDSNILNMLFALVIEYILVYFILKIKRLKNGLSFFQKNNEFIEIAVINICVFIIILYGLLGYNDDRVFSHLIIYFIILVICMIITIQKILVMYYKQKLLDDTINQYKEDLQNKDEEIKRLTEETFKVSKVNHEFYNRQKSLELMVTDALKNSNMEAGEDFDILSRIREVTSEHSEKMREIKFLNALDSTDIVEIDDMFKYMQKECDEKGIVFKLKVNGNIHPLVNNIISKSRLETLIGDHIRDAIIAIESSENRSNNEIFVILGIKDDCYELCIFDTGVEFEIDTLLKLGLEPVTTHKDSGGSGIGFVTTFETLKECEASLIIEEFQPSSERNYTKAVKVRFDGKNEYRICSYRADVFNNKNIGNRILVSCNDKM